MTGGGTRVRVTCAVVAGCWLTASGYAQQSPPRTEVSRDREISCRQLLPAGGVPATWIETPDPNDRIQLARWCETVGPVFFQQNPAAAAGEPLDRLAIVSWNIHEGGGDADELIRRLRLGEFTGGAPIDQFVLLLQEATRRDSAVPRRIPRGYPAPRPIVSRRDSKNADVRRFADEGLSVLYAPSMRNGEPARGDRDQRAEDRGNAILSTLPLLEPRLVELPLERQRRVVVVAAVEGRTSRGAPWRLDLVNVHLDTALALLHGGPFAARRRQATALLSALGVSRAQVDSERAMVLAGDFNTWRGEGEAAIRFLTDAFPATPSADQVPTWRGPLGTHATLDHVFVRGPVSPSHVVRLPSRFGSDHFPLMTVVAF